MAEPIIFTVTPILLGTSNDTVARAYKQDIRLALDVSRFDIIDVGVLVINPSSTDAITVDFLTGMQMDQEDAIWDSTATAIATVSLVPTAATNLFKTVSVPGNNALLRYLRFRAYFANSGKTAQLSLQGMGRRRGA